MSSSAGNFVKVVLILLITISLPYFVQAYRNFKFSSLMQKADTSFQAKDYPQAVNLWNKAKALSRDNGLECQRRITKAAVLNQSKVSFQKALQSMSKNEYIEAIKHLNSVSTEDVDNYINAQLKIAECKKAFINHQLNLAEQKALQSAYYEGLKILISAKEKLEDKQFDLAIDRFSDMARIHNMDTNVLGITNVRESRQVVQKMRKAIPVLMYHSIDFQRGNALKLPGEKFRAHMYYLKRSGYTTLSLDEFYACLKGQMVSPEKPVVVTFDDGYADNYIYAFPVLKELNLKATIFMITDYIDTNPAFLNRSQIKEMDLNGVAVESHTPYHDDLSVLSYASQYKILKASKEKLQQIVNRPILYLSYPVGKYNAYTEKAARDAGFLMAFTTRPGFARLENGIYFLHRIRINSDITLEGFKGLL